MRAHLQTMSSPPGGRIHWPLPARIAAMVLRSGIRGGTRATLALAKFIRSLQAIPLHVEDDAVLYLDLRLASTYGLLIGRLPEEHERDVIRRSVQVGDIVLDIGAHVGLHTATLSKRVGTVGHVYAFEPNPAVLPALRRTIEGLGNVSLFPIALSDRAGTAELVVPADPSMASLSDWTKGRFGRSNRAACETRRLDDFVAAGALPHPDFIKCDVEGAEALVFSGARATLDRADAPCVLFEANPNTASGFALPVGGGKAFLEGLREARYTCYLIGEGGLFHCGDIPATGANILAVPESRRAALLKRLGMDAEAAP